MGGRNGLQVYRGFPWWSTDFLENFEFYMMVYKFFGKISVLQYGLQIFWKNFSFTVWSTNFWEKFQIYSMVYKFFGKISVLQYGLQIFLENFQFYSRVYKFFQFLQYGLQIFSSSINQTKYIKR